MYISNSGVITRSSELCVEGVNKSNHAIQTPYISHAIPGHVPIEIGKLTLKGINVCDNVDKLDL
jgi:hypothetical protein